MTKTQHQFLKGVLIDPVNRTVTEVEVNKGYHLLEDLYKIIGTDIVETVRMPGRNTLWVDEEGLFKKGNPMFKFHNVGQGAFVGKAVVLGNQGSGCSDAKFSVGEVEKLVEWTDKVATGE